MEINYWLKKWTAGDTQFHRSEFYPALLKFFPVTPPGTVFVPLCGKSRDMLWLADKGWCVIGVEASVMACRAFFEENGLAYHEETADRGFTLFRGARITLYCGDFFRISKEDLAGVTAVYDRAALIALPPEARERYAAHLSGLFAEAHVQYLLVAMEYPQALANGPPFSVEAAEVRRLYEDTFGISELRRCEDTVTPKVVGKFKDVAVVETVYMMVS